MDADDMILISVDDHLVEPPDLFDGHMPAQVRATGPRRSCAPTTGRRRLGVRRRRRSRTSGSTRSPAGPRRSTASSRPPSTRCAPAATTSHERVKDMNAGGVLGVDVLPVVPRLLRPALRRHRRQGPRARRRAGLQRLAHRRVVRRLPRPLHPDGAARALGPRAGRGRGAPRGGEGLPLGHVHREPGDARLPELPRRRTGTRSGQALCDERRRAVDPPRLVGQARRHRARRADRRDDHAAADEHLPGRGRPRVVAGPQGVPRPPRSPCPRAAPAGSRTSSTASTAPTTCTTSGPARTSATSCPATCSASTSSPASSPTRSACSCATASASTTSRWERDYPHSDSSWPTAPEELARGRRRRARRRAQQDHARERDALVLVRPVRPPRPEQSTVGALRAEAAGHDVSTTHAFDKGRFEPSRSRRRPRRAGQSNATA